jgi:hypothetical protein
MFPSILAILIASHLTLPMHCLITRFLPTCTKFLTSIGLFTHLVVAILHQQFCLAIFLSMSSLLVINTSRVALCFENSQLALIFLAAGMTFCIISRCWATPHRFMATLSTLYVLRTATPHPLFGRFSLPSLLNFVPCATFTWLLQLSSQITMGAVSKFVCVR